MPQLLPTSLYSIAAVSKLTGLSCHTLRVWERRYGFPEPLRSASGHRRYGHDEVALLRALSSSVRSGRPIRDALREVRGEGHPRRGEPDLVEPLADVAQGHEAPSTALLDSLQATDLALVEPEYARSAASLSAEALATLLLEPALVEAGERLFRGEWSLCQERHASNFLLRKLTVLLDAAKMANPEPKGCVLVGCARGDRHEGGPLIVGLALETAGWRSIHLGADLPVSEYQAAINYWRPDAVAVSFVLSRNIRRRFEELSRLRGAAVYLGGRSIVNYQSLATRFGLVPLPGRAFAAVATMIERLEERRDAEVANDNTPPEGEVLPVGPAVIAKQGSFEPPSETVVERAGPGVADGPARR